MRGHEEASGTKYVPEQLMKDWAKKDPVDNFRAYLIEKRLLTEKEDNVFREAILDEINEHLYQMWKLN